QRENRGGERIDAVGWDRVVGEGLPGERITQRRGEDAVALVGGRHTGDAADAAGDARPFVVGEIERAVLQDRAADVAARLVLVVVGLGRAGLLREVVDGVHRLVAEVLVAGAVDGVGARLGRDADRRAGRPSVLGRVRAGHDLELLDR